MKAILRIGITILACSIIAIKGFFPALLAGSISPVELTSYVNSARISHELAPLKYNKKLERAAYQKGLDMFAKQYWAHYGPNKESPWQFIAESGYSYVFAGENLAKGYSDSRGVHEAWMASPSHRENILDGNYSEIGIAVLKGTLQGSDTYLVVQMFGNTGYPDSIYSREKYPYITITSPGEGEILNDGAFTIKGTINKLQDNKLSIFEGDTQITGIDVQNSMYEITVQPINPDGEKEIVVKAVGQGDTYLAERVHVKFINKIKEIGVEDCVQLSLSGNNLLATYTCGAVPLSKMITDIVIQYNSASYILKTSPGTKLFIPFDSEKTTVLTEVKYSDGNKSYFTKNVSQSEIEGTSRNSVISHIQPYTVVLIISFAYTFSFLIILYISFKRNKVNELKKEIIINFFLLFIWYGLIFGGAIKITG